MFLQEPHSDPAQEQTPRPGLGWDTPSQPCSPLPRSQVIFLVPPPILWDFSFLSPWIQPWRTIPACAAHLDSPAPLWLVLHYFLK